jgi:hypothetical protein
MVKDYEFYQINLCQDIQKNTDLLRYFIKNYENREVKSFIEDKIYEDMVFDVTHILNSETNTIYFLNEFSTVIYKNLKDGVDKDVIISKLQSVRGMPSDIEKDVNALVDALLDKEILKELKSEKFIAIINKELIKKSKYKLIFNEYLEAGTKKLVIEYKKEK